ncbi:hypothetical protein [Actinoplanes sp. NPDC026619]|uniref:hypothetical protein n=1 Tax=Actinoplanes sp. NPDC026619 TaxID=3155798 RepID=UPI0033FD1D6F
MTALERRYRVLLLAYPGRYRRRHGREIVTTLMEMAGDGQTRPGAADAWHLFLSGLRQRFRLPARRPLVWVAAALITLIGGAFGAAAGSWVAGQTYPDLPGDATVTALTRQAAGGGDDFGMTRSSSPWFTDTASGVLNVPAWDPAAAQGRLAAGGWHVGAIQDLAGAAYRDGVDRVELHGSGFDATRDGLLMHVAGYVTAEHGTVSTALWPADTGALRPLMFAGAAIGLILGWLIAAAGAYRLRGRPAGRRRAATALSALAIVCLAAPAFAFYINVMRVLHASGPIVNTVHSALNASPYWSYSTPRMLALLTVAGGAFAVAAWAVLGRRGPAEPPGRVTAAG